MSKQIPFGAELFEELSSSTGYKDVNGGAVLCSYGTTYTVNPDGSQGPSDGTYPDPNNPSGCPAKPDPAPTS